MGLHRVALLIAACVLAASLSVVDSKAAMAPKFEASTPSLRNDIAATRLPRPKKREESLSKFLWEKTDENLYTVFDILKLENLGGNLFSSRKFKLWSDFADKIYTKHGGALGASSSMLKWGRHAWRRGGQWLVLGRGVGPRGQQQDEDEDAVQDGGWALAGVMALVVKKPKQQLEQEKGATQDGGAAVVSAAWSVQRPPDRAVQWPCHLDVPLQKGHYRSPLEKAGSDLDAASHTKQLRNSTTRALAVSNAQLTCQI
ncbi:hypothetical protein PHYSODRAFT_340009 [Phytophthora sojae]|uniref:RxLR effector protein n=1 Tax=Phytophthora sojae (strain P6497) TaxID=1094619 RepID=G5A8E8_PHYSP|nr:hypothetical protein PHYSODRAFT_340009 [Phytophthora sojae]EGZ08174.1 hypothetical protein PHYSODRAFT_340009 [Phytophthora sojae]|eukprot:XP_009536346.1 hypothetical protein PHYSODRAFT_340009 [Phytophthora sojae]